MSELKTRAPSASATRASDMLATYVVGAGGMLAGEFLRLAQSHPGLALRACMARQPGALASVHPHLPALGHSCSIADGVSQLRAELETSARALVVLALPHGESALFWRTLRSELGARADAAVVVDLSADYRLADPGLYAATYGGEHPDPEELPRFVYGLPEQTRAQLAGARRIAAPGCFATALQLATLPAARAGVLAAHAPWIYHGVTGSSGSGNKPGANTHHPHRDGNLWAYAVGGHRHEAELAQALGAPALGGVDGPKLHFVAHSGPFVRGIHLSASLPLASEHALDSESARSLYADAYAGEPFVEILSAGSPDLRSVVGSNRASVAASVRHAVLHVALTIDNLIKGGAGQAVQALNIACGWPEERGLASAGWGVH